MEKRFDELFYNLDHADAQTKDLKELQELKEISLELLKALKIAAGHVKRAGNPYTEKEKKLYILRAIKRTT